MPKISGVSMSLALTLADDKLVNVQKVIGKLRSKMDHADEADPAFELGHSSQCPAFPSLVPPHHRCACGLARFWDEVIGASLDVSEAREAIKRVLAALDGGA